MFNVYVVISLIVFCIYPFLVVHTSAILSYLVAVDTVNFNFANRIIKNKIVLILNVVHVQQLNEKNLESSY